MYLIYALVAGQNTKFFPDSPAKYRNALKGIENVPNQVCLIIFSSFLEKKNIVFKDFN